MDDHETNPISKAINDSFWKGCSVGVLTSWAICIVIDVIFLLAR